MSKSRGKALIIDLIAFLMSGASIKLISFFMMPLYTYYLSTEDYALSDLVTLSIQLAIPLLTLSISDSVLRFGLEYDSDLESVFGTGLSVVLCGILAAFPICVIVGMVSGDRLLAVVSFLLFTVQNMNNYFSAYFKCIDKTRQMALVSSLSGVSVILLNVVFIAGLHLGLRGYWLGNVLGNSIGLGLYLLLGGWSAFCYLRKPEREILTLLLSYSIPLIPNSLFWWINSSMDRFVLTALSTLSFVGLYSAASKIPQILSTLSGFFFQAWNISVFRDFGSADSTYFFRKGFSIITTGSFLISGMLIVINIPLARILFSGDFFEAWYLVPLLLTGTAVSIINQFLGSVFTASKETKVIFSTTVIGSVINVILNIIFVVMFGGVGAVVATLISYLVVLVARAVKISRNFTFLRFSYVMPSIQIVGLIILSVFAMNNCDVLRLGIVFLVLIITHSIVSLLQNKKSSSLRL